MAGVAHAATLAVKAPIDASRTVVSPKEGVMNEEKKARTMRMGHGSLAGVVWFGGWLFTMAFAKLLWWQCIVGLVIWPYYMGTMVR